MSDLIPSTIRPAADTIGGAPAEGGGDGCAVRTDRVGRRVAAERVEENYHQDHTPKMRLALLRAFRVVQDECVWHAFFWRGNRF